MSMLAAAVVAAVTAAGHLDTTLTVKTGARLEVSNFSGGVSVSTWDKNAVRVAADFGGRTRVTLDPSPTTLRVNSEGQRGTAGVVDYQITMPSWMGIEVSGPFTDVDVVGSRGDVKVETVKGDVSVNGGNGVLELNTVQGDIALAGSKGRIKLNTINGDITLAHIMGQLTTESVNGDQVMDDVQLDALESSSVSGDLWFNGALKSDGRYHLQSHNGDIDVVAPDKPNAVISVSTFSGEFNSDFDVTFTGTNGHREMQFTLGEGGPRLELESFSGNIRLLKSGAGEALRTRLRGQSGQPAPKAPETPKPPKSSKSSKPPKAPTPPKPPNNED